MPHVGVTCIPESRLLGFRGWQYRTTRCRHYLASPLVTAPPLITAGEADRRSLCAAKAGNKELSDTRNHPPAASRTGMAAGFVFGAARKGKQGAWNMDIKEWRSRIDKVDEQLLRLLSVRAQLAIEIGRGKREEGAEVYDPAREQEVVRRVLEANPGVLDAEAIGRLFQEIVNESRRAAEQAADRAGEAGEVATERRGKP